MFRLAVLVMTTALVSGCASVRSKLPFGSHTSAQITPPSAFHRDPHRQYFDKLRKRYYYYDVARKSYFWESGQPKG